MLSEECRNYLMCILAKSETQAVRIPALSLIIMVTEPPRCALCCGKAPHLLDLSLLGIAQ